MPVIEVTDPVSFREHLRQSQQNGQLVVVDYFATWCGPCKVIAPVIETLSNEMNHIKFLKVDVDEQIELSTEAGISSMPTFGFWINGKLVTTVEGADSRAVKEKCTMYGNPLVFTKPNNEIQHIIKSILDDLKSSIHEPQHQIDGCLRLFQICDDEPTQVFIVANGGLDALIDCMINYSDNIDVQKQVCGTFLKFQYFDGFVQSGCIEAVIEIMRKHSSSSAYQAITCEALSLMSLHELNANKIVQLDGIKLIIESMKHHLIASDVQQWACRALASLSEVDEVDIVESGSINQIIHAMQHHPNVADVQEAACYALCRLVQDDSSAVAIVEAGGLDGLMKAMQSCLDVTSVLTCACQALMRLGAEPENRVEMDKAGCIEMIISVMRRHVNNADVQQHACAAIKSMIAENESNETKFCDGNGIETIISGMRHHLEDPRNLSMACELLFELASMNSAKKVENAGAIELLSECLDRCATFEGGPLDYSDVSKTLLMMSGLDPYLGFMKRNLNNMMVQRVGMMDLCCYASIAEISDTVTAVNLEFLFDSMSKHLDDAEVQQFALEFLDLIVDESNVQRVADAGVIETIINGMKRHLVVVPVQIDAFAVFCTLCTCGKDTGEEVQQTVQNKIAAAGGIDLIIKGMMHHPDEVAVQGEALLALRDILSDNIPNQLETVELGGVEAIVKGMQQFLVSEKLQSLGCECLGMLVDNESLKQHMIDNCKAETVAAFINAMQRHESAEVQEAGNRALDKLTLSQHCAMIDQFRGSVQN